MSVSWQTLELHTAPPFGIARWTQRYPRTVVTLERGGRQGRGGSRCLLGLMMGCMIESSLGIAAAHLAGLCDWADLDGGRAAAAHGPGLGVTRV